MLSVSYAHAVAAMAGAVLTKRRDIDVGFELLEPASHDYGIDLTFSPVRVLPNKKRQRCGLDYHFQLKCTVNFTLYEADLSYRMEADAYNKFAAWEGPAKYHLLVMCLPEDEAQWVTFSEDDIRLRHCCYWCHIPPGAMTKSDKVIRIPRKQIFDHNALISIINPGK